MKYCSFNIKEKLSFRGNIPDIINLKTASHFPLPKTGACLFKNEKKKALESYGRNLGLAFQIADDALDYYAKEKLFGKQIVKIFLKGK